MKKILLILPILLSMGIAMAAIKPYTLKKISTAAFDFSMDTTEINGIDIDYLEYGRADAMVTETDLDFIPNSGDETYKGTLKFAVRGIEDGHIFTVVARSEGPLDCSVFTETAMTCYADITSTGKLRSGVMKVKGKLIDLCYFEISADKVADTLIVKAEDCLGNTVLDAAVEDWTDRIPQKPITFNYFYRCYGICS